ncbi:nucleotidyltransferase family protein [Croceibacterium mercuriale]|uniref:nucleotidyltransferase family protein n=1 Tax=Croceibacterium mercuriale TaxID=1572751 RepID=UPI00068CD9FE|nr:NTP transferase domain-containing protein [Croceibacterium mercuriale]
MAEQVLAAVLAAGRGRRFGGGKLDARCAGRPLGAWALQAVAQAGIVQRIIIVPPQVPGFAQQSGWPLFVNPASEDGLGTSLACAARAAMQQGAGALLVLLADMPLVDAALLRRLLASPAPAAVAHAPGRPGVPALLPASILPELASLAGDSGAAGLLRTIAGLALVSAPAAALLDVDDAAGLAQAVVMLLQGHA